MLGNSKYLLANHTEDFMRVLLSKSKGRDLSRLEVLEYITILESDEAYVVIKEALTRILDAKKPTIFIMGVPTISYFVYSSVHEHSPIIINCRTSYKDVEAYLSNSTEEERNHIKALIMELKLRKDWSHNE